MYTYIYIHHLINKHVILYSIIIHYIPCLCTFIITVAKHISHYILTHPDAFDIARKRFDPVPEARKCLAFEDSINGVKSAISQGSRINRFDDLG